MPSTPLQPRPRSAWMVVGVIVAVVALATVAVLIFQPDTPARAPEQATVDQTGPVTVTGTLPPFNPDLPDPAVGQKAPELFGVDFTGKAQTIRSGRPTMVVIVTHWCPHCQAEVPKLVDWMSRGGADGVDVVLISTAVNRAAPNYPPSEWVQRERWRGRVIVDDTQDTAARHFGLTSFPFVVFVDRDGNVTKRLTGEQPPDTWDAAISDIR